MISSMPRIEHQVAMLHYQQASGVWPSRRWWTIKGVRFWGDVMEARYEADREGVLPMYADGLPPSQGGK